MLERRWPRLQSGSGRTKEGLTKGGSKYDIRENTGMNPSFVSAFDIYNAATLGRMTVS
jgi:hypothetical protein